MGLNVVALSGGVGGAKMLVGLDRALTATGGELSAIVNTGDDATVYGVYVSPDIDIVSYWLSGIADVDRGWGIRGDTFTVVDALRKIGYDAWFSLGDRDFATCIYRTRRLAEGATLTDVTHEIGKRLGVRPALLPMSDDPVRTRFVTVDGDELDFQEYFVKHRCEPKVAEVLLAGIAEAAPGPAVLGAIAGADVVVVCPSNPVVSTAPILAVAGIRDALRRHPAVAAVSPIVGGASLKGPADVLLSATGTEVSAAGVASLYADFCNFFVVDRSDASVASAVEDLGTRPLVLPAVMHDHDAAEALARAILAEVAK